MAARRLKGDGSLPDEIVAILFQGATPAEMTKLALSFLDLTLNHVNVDDTLRAEMVCAICWEHGLNPPDHVKELII
jgi:hypothetical protein